MASRRESYSTLELMPVHALWLSEGLGYSWDAKRRGIKTSLWVLLLPVTTL